MSIVYSTDGGKLCPACRQPVARCRCRSDSSAPPGDGIVRLQRQVKGRKGKPVVIIDGLPLASTELKSLAKKLKARCGVGGSVDAGKIIIQGDKREFIKTELETLGYTVKISGG
ncbi:MAG: stress response translation initiation inhibitor YciH [Pseudomonadales bacterium]